MDRGTAMLAGGTGLVGGHCLRLLLADYARVVALVRRRVLPSHPSLEERVVDFDDLAATVGPLGGDDLFCCLGTTLAAAGSRDAFRRVDHGYVVELARLAVAAGVRRCFLVSALGADSGSRIFYNRVKGETEDALAELGFAALHVVRPSLLLGPREESRPAERVGQWLGRLTAPLFRGRLARYAAIDAADVAAALLACARSTAGGVQVHYPTPRRSGR